MPIPPCLVKHGRVEVARATGVVCPVGPCLTKVGRISPPICSCRGVVDSVCVSRDGKKIRIVVIVGVNHDVVRLTNTQHQMVDRIGIDTCRLCTKALDVDSVDTISGVLDLTRPSPE